MEALKNVWSYISTTIDTEPDLPDDYLPAIPPPGTIFKEGYMQKHSRTPGMNNWRRRFFILECAHSVDQNDPTAQLTYGDAFNSTIKQKFIITRETTLEYVKDYSEEGFSKVIRLNSVITNNTDPSFDQETPLNIYINDFEQLESWYTAFTACINRLKGEAVSYPDTQHRFFEGTIFKLTHDKSKWMARHFELDGDELRYYHSPGGELRGRLSLIGVKINVKTTDAESAPTKYVFQIQDKNIKLNLACRNETSYLFWMKAIVQNLKNTFSNKDMVEKSKTLRKKHIDSSRPSLSL